MAFAAVYTAPLRASICPAGLKRTVTAKASYNVVAPAESPMTPSMGAAFGVASN